MALIDKQLLTERKLLTGHNSKIKINFKRYHYVILIVGKF